MSYVPSPVAPQPAPEGWTLKPVVRDTYTSARWSGYGYIAMMAIHPDRQWSGQCRSIPGRQTVVYRSDLMRTASLGSARAAVTTAWADMHTVYGLDPA